MIIARILIILLIPAILSATTLSDLRWEILSQINISTSGVAQLTTADTDSIIARGLKKVATDYPLTVSDTTITLVAGTRTYSLPSGFLELPGQVSVSWCVKKKVSDNGDTTYTLLEPVPSPAAYFATLKETGAMPPQVGDDPLYVWTHDDSLEVWPPPVDGQTIDIAFRAYSTISAPLIEPAYRDKLVQWCCWMCLYKIKRFAEGDVWKAAYYQQ